MRFKALAAIAAAIFFALAAPTAAFAAVTHDATLTGSVVAVQVNVEEHNAGQQASVLVMRVGARYSAPAPTDIVLLNEYTADSSGVVTFSATLPGGELDDYVLAVNVAGASSRYLASLDPAGPVPVDAPEPGTDPVAGVTPGGLAATGITLAVGLLITVALCLVVAGAVLAQHRRRARTTAG